MRQNNHGAWHHYVTVTKIDGDKITYLDSNVSPEEDMERTMEVDKLFSGGKKGSYIALTWFSKLKPPKDMEKAYPGQMIFYRVMTGSVV